MLAQHIVGTACAQPIDRDAFYEEVRTALPYRDLSRQVSTTPSISSPPAAMRWRLRSLASPEAAARRRWMLASPLVARQYRMNVGTIVELPLIKVKMRRGCGAGRGRGSFVQGLVAGDTFVFAGRLLRFEGVSELVAQCSPATGGDPRCRLYGGGRLPLSTFPADRVRHPAGDPARHPEELPHEVREWLRIQRVRSTSAARRQAA